MPRLPSEVPIVIVQRRNSATAKTNDFRVRRHFVEFWLHWLKKHSPLKGYKDLNICQDRINQLPVDGVLDGLRTIDTDDTDFSTRMLARDYENQEDQGADIDGNPATNSTVPLPPSHVQSENQSINILLEKCI